MNSELEKVKNNDLGLYFCIVYCLVSSAYHSINIFYWFSFTMFGIKESKYGIDGFWGGGGGL